MIPTTVNHKLPKLVAFLTMFLALGGLNIPVASGEGAESKAVKANLLADGTYLYGESAQPNQVMKSYVVFKNRQGKIVGALYYPRSDFQCFTGSVKKHTLAVTSLNFEQPKTENKQIELSNLHKIDRVSANDRRIVSMCKQENISVANRN